MTVVKADELEVELDDFLEPEGVRVVEVSIGRGGGRTLLRVTIDRPGGVTVGDCEQVSHLLSDWLEERDPFAGRYVLEVSSPGIGRLFKRQRDYEVFSGRRVNLVVKDENNATSEVTGVLEGLEQEEIVVTDDGGTVHRFPLASVAKTLLE